MISLRIVGLSILVGSAGALLVWFGWGLLANFVAMRGGDSVSGDSESEAASAGAAKDA